MKWLAIAFLTVGISGIIGVAIWVEHVYRTEIKEYMRHNAALSELDGGRQAE